MSIRTKKNALYLLLVIIICAVAITTASRTLKDQKNTGAVSKSEPVANSTSSANVPSALPDPGYTFQNTGNLVLNNPGMQADVWHLLYSAPGINSVAAKLTFSNKMCVTNSGALQCGGKVYEKGARVRIKGMQQDNGWVDVLTVEAAP
jgi:hypothetical protein